MFTLTRVPPALKKSGGRALQALGRSRSGFSTKVHVAVAGLGNPLRLRLTGGQVHDVPHAPNLIDGFACQQILADRGCAAQAFVELIHEYGAIAVISPHHWAKTERAYDRWLYREHHLVECFINKIKHFRHVFSQFDKVARRYSGFLHSVSVLIWLH